MTDLPFAEEMPYWKSSKSSVSTWQDRTEMEVARHGGAVVAIGKSRDPSTGHTVFIVDFINAAQRFRAAWPVLESKWKNPSEADLKAAEVQAITSLYHDIKARSLRVRLFGFRSAYIDFLLLPNGMTLSQASGDEMEHYLKALSPAGAHFEP